MTYLERFVMDHPDADQEMVVLCGCPGDFYPDTSSKCTMEPTQELTCAECWNREMEEREDVHESEMP